jgi:hypothetical protein
MLADPRPAGQAGIGFPITLQAVSKHLKVLG